MIPAHDSPDNITPTITEAALSGNTALCDAAQIGVCPDGIRSLPDHAADAMAMQGKPTGFQRVDHLTLIDDSIPGIDDMPHECTKACEGMCGQRFIQTGSPFPACEICGGSGVIASACACPECQP